MEILLITIILGIFALGWWIRRRWVEGATAEPWVMLAAAAMLLAIAWGWGTADVRGPQVVLTLGAVIVSYRAGVILLHRADGRARSLE